VDGELSLVGTVNLDMRSLWLNFEITLVIDDTGFGADLAAVQDVTVSGYSPSDDIPAVGCATARGECAAADFAGSGVDLRAVGVD
ncbi:hypothetical protein ONO84_24720, partial [Salmonella enterica subsp. enterica serovar Virginia]|nr:hypothetical protein [Salmonella enterica subsp. enterica serovar Virginia]